MKKKEAALAYTSLGWHVFPLHTVMGDRCSCGRDDCTNQGKHPRTGNGLLNATNDPAQVALWWTQWPDANIGVRTGEVSGFVVVDIDDMDKRPLYDLPKTVYQKTGGGGEHHLYFHPGVKVKTTTKIVPGLDSRGDGGYIVVPPSNHLKGTYEWIESPFDGCDMGPVPEWWMEAIEAHRRDSDKVQHEPGAKIYQGSRNTSLFDYGCNAWKRMPMDHSVLLAILDAQNKVMCDPPLEDAEVAQIADHIVKYDGKTQEDYEAEKHGKAVWEAIRKGRQEEIAEALKLRNTRKAGPMPEFMPRSGLIREVAEYILSQSERPQPVLAVCAATALVGALAGRKYESPSRLGPNLLLVGLAESGSGKEKARKMIGSIASEIGAQNVMGADDIASAPGLIAELNENPVKLFMLDEFGYMLKAITDKNSASTKKEIMSVIMRMYSSYGGTYYGTAYADQTKRKKIIIDNPCMVLYATSTHQTFYDALSVDHGSDGFISRLLVIPAGEHRPDQFRPKYGPMPGHLKARLVELSGNVPVGIQRVPMTEQVDQAFFDLDDRMTEFMTTPQTRSVYARVKENAIKLALVYSIAQDFVNPIIDHDAFIWARDISIWCANHITEKLEDSVAVNDHDREHKKVVELIKSAGAAGIGKRDLLRKCTGLRAFDRDDILNTQLEIGDIYRRDNVFVHAMYREEADA